LEQVLGPELSRSQAGGAGFPLTLCMNALEPHFAIAASGTVEVLPFSPLPPSPAGVCGRKGEGG